MQVIYENELDNNELIKCVVQRMRKDMYSYNGCLFVLGLSDFYLLGQVADSALRI